MGSGLKLAVLGDFRVLRDGQAVPLPPSKKTRALLAYLAIVPRPQRRERLCEMFWEVPDDPRSALRWSLSRIRQIVGTGHESCVRADRNTVCLDPGGFDCDFRPIAALKPDLIDKLDTGSLEAIADSFQGGFLEDLYLPNCPEFEAWRAAYAEQAEVLRLRILRLLVDRTRDEPERALRHAFVLQALAPDAGLAAEIERIASQARQLAAAASADRLAPAREAGMPFGAAESSHESPPELKERSQRAGRPAIADQMRKQVSVLAAEIVTPFQELQEDDPEAGFAVISPLMRAARREVERWGGIVISSSDASVVGIFGAGLPSEDHSLQACRAALALKAAVETAAQSQVRLSIGLDSGETVLRPVPTGDTVKVETQGAVVRTARRLAQALRRDAIVCTARMKDAIAGFVTSVAMSADDFSGGPPAGSCYEIIGESKVISRWQLRRARGLTPLTGREAELGRLNEAWQRARAGAGQSIGVLADAGIGKSRLTYEFLASEAVAGCHLVEVGVFESDAVTSFHIVKKLLRTILAIEEGNDAADAAAKAGAFIESLGGDASLRPPVLFALDIPVDDREWCSLAPSERVRRVRNAITIVLVLMAKARPLIVLIEDLHWIDSDSEAVLERLIDGIATQRILLLMTFRPEYRQSWGAKSNYSQLRLEPLPRGQAASLLKAMLGDDASVRGLVPLIAEHTDGVPLFIEEAVQSLAQSGALQGSPGAYLARSEITSLRVPATVQSVIAARIGRLSADERWLLQNAAIVGRDVSLSILASIAGLDEQAATEAALKLQSAGFLYESQLYPVQIFTFKHALVQQVAYESLVKADRKLLHARLIDAVETLLPHLIDDYVERLSEHAIGAERWDKAEQYLLRSADRALQRSSHNLALSFLQKGLDILAKRPESPDRARVELEYQKLVGVAWMAAKGWGAREVLAAYERAEALCDELADESERFTALRGRAQYYMISGQPRAAQTISLRCAEMTKLMRDAGIAIETHHMFWTNNFFMGACGTAERHAEEAIGLYDADRHHALTYKYSGHDPGVCSRCFSGLAAWHRGALDRAAERCHEALALAERLSHPLTTALAYWALGCLGIFRREAEATLAWAQKEIAISDEYLLPLLRSQGEFQAGWATAQLGNVKAGIAQMEHGVQALRATGAEMGLPYLLGLMAETLAGAGRRDWALHVLDQAIGSAMQNGTHFLLSEIVRIKGEVLAQAKDRDAQEIESLLRRAVDIAAEQNAPLPALRAATGLARFLAGQRRRAEARVVLESHATLIATLAGTRDAASAAELT
jgi:DNA-binding SARP family transcriptional activator/predicted ATPase